MNQYTDTRPIYETPKGYYFSTGESALGYWLDHPDHSEPVKLGSHWIVAKPVES